MIDKKWVYIDGRDVKIMCDDKTEYIAQGYDDDTKWYNIEGAKSLAVVPETTTCTPMVMSNVDPDGAPIDLLNPLAATITREVITQTYKVLISFDDPPEVDVWGYLDENDVLVDCDTNKQNLIDKGYVLDESRWLLLTTAMNWCTGSIYDRNTNTFKIKKPYENWVWDEEEKTYCPPIPKPTDGYWYDWDQDSNSWYVIETPPEGETVTLDNNIVPRF